MKKAQFVFTTNNLLISSKHFKQSQSNNIGVCISKIYLGNDDEFELAIVKDHTIVEECKCALANF